MNQSSREKIALIVFSIAVAAFFIAVITYMVLAHSWNLAARSIDEHRGAMEGYTVFVYAGNQEPTEQQEDADDSLPMVLGGESEGSSSEEGSLQGEGQSDESVPESGGNDVVDDDIPSESAQDAEQTSDSEDSGIQEEVSVDSVAESYRSKEAAVLTVDIANPSRFEGDDIYLVGGMRIGIFYAAEGT
ncbi:MAG: hypothetical protein ACI4B9_05800, partial [Eggerthellaceae bacterium]